MFLKGVYFPRRHRDEKPPHRTVCHLLKGGGIRSGYNTAANQGQTEEELSEGLTR